MNGITISRWCPLTRRRLWPRDDEEPGRALGHTPVRLGGLTGSIGEFGWTRKLASGALKAHTGLDLLAPPGFPVFAAHVGRVTSARLSGAAGLRIKLVSDLDGQDVPDGSVGTRYAHLMKSYVEVGDRVVGGQLMGTVGESGNARGIAREEIHVHFETRMRIEGIYVLVHPGDWLNGVPSPRLFEEMVKGERS